MSVLLRARMGPRRAGSDRPADRSFARGLPRRDARANGRGATSGPGPALPSNGSKNLGFACSLALDAPSRLSRGWIFELENAAGSSVEIEAPEPIEDPLAARDAIVSTLEAEWSPGAPATEHILPAVARLQERLASMVEIEQVERFGDTPLFAGRLDRRPVVQAGRPAATPTRPVRVRPRAFRGGAHLCAGLPGAVRRHARRGGTAVRALPGPVPPRDPVSNGGFAVANNLGASLANGRLLLLLNSDVLPASPGWLCRLAALHDATPRIGALGPSSCSRTTRFSTPDCTFAALRLGPRGRTRTISRACTATCRRPTCRAPFPR